MNADSRSQNLVEPVGERSRLIRCNAIEIGHLHDVYVLLEPVSRITCLLRAEHARVWLECDGRPLIEVLHSLRSESLPSTRDLLDTLRALRVLGMIEDARFHPESQVLIQPEPLSSSHPRPPVPDLTGRLQCDEETCVLRIADLTIEQDRELDLIEALTRLAAVLDDTTIDAVIQLCSSFRVTLSPDKN